MGIFVEISHIGVRRRIVRVVIVFLHVFAVIALPGRETKEPLLQVRVPAVPERRREAQELVAVADAGDAVIAPPVRFGACLVIGEVPPGIPDIGIVLAYRAPGALR